MTIYGYARVSTKEQSLSVQTNALFEYGCQHIFEDVESGRKTFRSSLTDMLGQLQKGDTVVVWKLDRLGRTTKQLIDLTFRFKENQITFISIKEQLNTSTPLGKFYFTLMAGLAEMEVDLIRERTMAGLEVARKQGRVGGRPPISIETQQRLKRLYQLKRYSYKELAYLCNISPATAHKYIKTLSIT